VASPRSAPHPTALTLPHDTLQAPLGHRRRHLPETVEQQPPPPTPSLLWPWKSRSRRPRPLLRGPRPLVTSRVSTGGFPPTPERRLRSVGGMPCSGLAPSSGRLLQWEVRRPVAKKSKDDELHMLKKRGTLQKKKCFTSQSDSLDHTEAISTIKWKMYFPLKVYFIHFSRTQ
jgi:hypothetical protein